MKALEGIRVVDVGQLVQAPQAALLLADLGADVVKVELPMLGDQARWIPAVAGHTHSGFYEACNRGKRSIALDLRNPAGKDAFLRLCDSADVLVSNFKPGTLDDWGLGYDVVSGRNPRIIYATGSAFGPVGPDAQLEGADMVGQAAGGLVSTTGRDGTEPTPVGATVADHLASQHLAAGILAALFVRERTGRGQRVDVSLLGGAIWAQASEYTAYFMSGVIPGRANRSHPLINGLYGILPTADGHIAIVGVPLRAKDAFLKAVEMPTLFDDPRFPHGLLTPENKQALLDELVPVFRRKTTAEWCAILRSAEVRYSPVNDYAAVTADPQVWENGYLVKIDHPALGPINAVGSPLRMSETPTDPTGVAPVLGQHTEEILLEIGYDWDGIGALRDAGAL